MEHKNILIRVVLFVFILIVINSFLMYYLNRKNIVFKKCLDVVPQENLLNLESFKTNVDICKSQN